MFSSDLSVATLVMLPRQHRQDSVNSLITSQLSSLREHIVMRNLKTYLTKSASRPSSHTPPLKDMQTPPTRSLTSPPTPPIQNQPRNRRNMSEPSISSVNERQRNQNSSDTALSLIREIPPSTTDTPPPIDSRDATYLQMAQDKSDRLVTFAEATENDGWVSVGTKQNVRIMKFIPKREETPINCVKGTGIVNAPPKFVMHFLKDPTYTTRLDDMLKEVHLIHKISPAVQLVHMLYKGVWPTAPRDFALLNITGQRDTQTWVSAAVSIVDSRIPETKGYVRGHLETGGYVIQAVSDNPNVSKVTYVAQVDLRGSIPIMVTNKIADTQPMNVNILRGIVEPLYTQLSQSQSTLSEYENKFPISVIVEERGVAHTEPQVRTLHTHHTITHHTHTYHIIIYTVNI